MDELNSYAKDLQDRWSYHEGPGKIQRDLATQAAEKAAGLPEPQVPGESAQPKASGTKDTHVPNPLEALAGVGETLSAPLRMLILQGLGKPTTATGKDGQLSGEDFRTNLGLNSPESGLGEKALGLGAEILTDPTSALPIGGKGAQKAITAGAEAAQSVIKGIADAGKASEAVNKVVPEAAKLTDTSLSDPSLDLFKSNPAFTHQGTKTLNVKDLQLEHTLDEKGTQSALQYEEKYKKGEAVPNLVVREEGGKYHVMSGNARTVAAGRAGKEAIKADVFTEKSPAQQIEDMIAANPTMSAKKAQIMRESVGIPTSAYGRHAKAVYNQKAGLESAVVDDSVAKTFGYTFDDSPLAKSRYEFLQDVIQEEAAQSGVTVSQYQKIFRESALVIEKNPDLQKMIEKLAADPDAQDIVNLSKASGKVLANEAGVAKATSTLLLTRILAGAAIGAYADDNALEGALAGAGIALSPEAFASLRKGLKKVAPSVEENAKSAEAKVRMKQVPPAWKPGFAEERFNTLRKELNARAAKDAPRPLSQVEEEAKAIVGYQDVSPETLKALAPNAVLNDADMRAAQIVVAESADHLRTIAMNTDASNPAQMQEFMKQLYVHGHMDLGRQFAEGGVGRALNVTKLKNGETLAINQMESVVREAMSGVSPQRILELARQTYSKDHLTKFADSMSKPSFKDMFVEYWVNGLLSSPKTWIINPASSALFHTWNMFEKGASVLYGNVNAPREAFAMAQGSLMGLKQAWRLSWEMLKGENVVGKYANAQKMDFSHHAITAENVKNLSPIKSLGEITKPLLSKVESVGPIGTTIDYLGHVSSKMIDATGKVARVSRRVMLSQDEFARSIAFSSETYRGAVVNATADVDAAGLTGSAARDLYKKRFAYWIENPSQETVAQSKEYGNYITFTKMLGESGQKLQELSNSSIAMKAALPFVTAPINIAKTGFLERTPLGIASETFRAELRAGGERRQMALTRMSVGSAFLAMASEWATQGIIVAPTEKDPQLRKALREGGQLPFAINLTAIRRGGPARQDARPVPGDELLDFTKMDPTLSPALTLAGLYAASRSRMSDEEANNVALELSIAVGEYVGQKSWLSGAGGLASAITDPDQYLDNWANRQIGTLNPLSGMSSAIARGLDPIKRDPQTVWQSILVKLPHLSQQVIPDRNRYGEIVHYPPAMGPDMASPFYYDVVKNDKVLMAMREDQVALEKLPAKVMGVTLTDRQYDEYRVIFGQEVIDRNGHTLREAEEAILQEAKDEGHTTGPDSWRKAALQHLDQEFRVKAQKILMKRHPDLKDKVLERDQEKRMKLDKPAESRLPYQIELADEEGVDVRRSKIKVR